MMLNFPLPYQDELIYSTIARAGVHHGITSPKQLLDEVYGDRKVIATTDLPNHLNCVAKQLPEKLRYDVEKLAYQHTLFPVYAPFTTEDRRQKCLRWMSSSSQGAVHLVLGVAASRVKQQLSMRYCPECLKEQKKRHGEYFWARQWQLTGADCCLLHGALSVAEPLRHGYHRHQFFPATPKFCQQGKCQPAHVQDRRITRQVVNLLSESPCESVSFEQWSAYYKKVATKGGCSRGKQIQYEKIRDRVAGYWSEQWLEKQGLLVTNDQTCWLRGIFRKHRKSFSYLEHIAAIRPFQDKEWRITDSIQEMKRDATHSSATEFQSRDHEQKRTSDKALNLKRGDWLKLVSAHGAKVARRMDGALYARLYRNDRFWLLDANKQHQRKRELPKKRIDWSKRDKKIVRELLRINLQLVDSLDSPRQSRNWFLSKLSHSATIEKNPAEFPLINRFFQRYCEDITDYQIRRITCALVRYQYPAHKPERWQLLRYTGLSDERLTPITERFLQEVLDYNARNTF